jgi:hypothetical protein
MFVRNVVDFWRTTRRYTPEDRANHIILLRINVQLAPLPPCNQIPVFYSLTYKLCCIMWNGRRVVVCAVLLLICAVIL